MSSSLEADYDVSAFPSEQVSDEDVSEKDVNDNDTDVASEASECPSEASEASEASSENASEEAGTGNTRAGTSDTSMSRTQEVLAEKAKRRKGPLARLEGCVDQLKGLLARLEGCVKEVRCLAGEDSILQPGEWASLRSGRKRETGDHDDAQEGNDMSEDAIPEENDSEGRVTDDREPNEDVTLTRPGNHRHRVAPPPKVRLQSSPFHTTTPASSSSKGGFFCKFIGESRLGKFLYSKFK